MTITELLNHIRQPYIDQLSRTAAEADFHVEPVLRGRDGSVMCEGVLHIPYRCDLVHKETFERRSVDATEFIRFDTVSCGIGKMRLHVSGFSWDMLTLVIDGMSQAAAEQTMRNWFLRWFDENDSNAANAEGLYGVVHFMSDPEIEGTTVRFELDLGSAPSDAISTLIEELHDQGASELKFGRELCN